jgi:hypothetical protein
MLIQAPHYRQSKKISPELKQILAYELKRAKKTWEEYWSSDPDLRSFLPSLT